MGDLEDLLGGWRTLSEWEGDPYRDHRRWNRVVDRCNRLAERLVADPVGVEQLRRVAAEDPDRSVRLRARQFVTPYVPRPDSKRDLERWTRHPLIGIAEIELGPRVSFGLTGGEEFEDDPEAELSEIDLNWFGGEPVAVGDGSWPLRSDGTPLTHLLQVEIGRQPLFRDRYPDIPWEGVLQFFHDLEEPATWQVRLLTEPPTALLAHPGGSPQVRRRAHLDPIWTFPDSRDLDLSGEEAARLDVANRRVHETLFNAWGYHEMAEPAPVYPLMLACGAPPGALREARPLSVAGDEHVLLLSLPGTQILRRGRAVLREDALRGQGVLGGEGTVRGRDVLGGEGTVRGRDVLRGEGTVRGRDVLGGEGTVRGRDAADSEGGGIGEMTVEFWIRDSDLRRGDVGQAWAWSRPRR